jgi:hypothetical protein
MGQALVNAGGVWVHSREKDSGSIKVSSQQMTVVSDVLAQYQTYQAMKASADSYGGINVSVAYLKPETLGSITSGSGSTVQGSETGGNGGSENGSGGSQSGGSDNGSGNGGSTGGDSSGEPSGTVAVEMPVISGTTPFTESTQVTMSGPEGASIYYTTDGSVPTGESTVYSEAFSVTDTTTVKAVAIKNGSSSGVAEKVFTKSTGGSGGFETGS